MSTDIEFAVNTGNPETDRQHLAHYQQHYASMGMHVQATPMAAGGYMLRVSNPAAGHAPQAGYAQAGHGAQAGWQQPQHAAQPSWQTQQAHHQAQQAQQAHQAQQAQQAQHASWQQHAQQQGGSPQWGGAQPAYAMAGAAAYQGPTSGQAQGAGLGAVVGEAVAELGVQRVRYLRKVYLLLGAACFVALAAGWIAIHIGPTVSWTGAQGEGVEVPWLVSIMLANDAVFWGCFGLLVASTFVASWVSKIRIVNVVALFGVAAIMGVQLAPMSFVAMYFAGLGDTLTANPVRDAGLMTAATFLGISGYIFITRKDFSYLKAILNIGFWVILAGCVLTFFLDSEPFALAVASAGALFSAGFLLYVTSYIFKHSEMDDPVGDALAILVQLRNLFMFLLRIFMSSRN